MGLFFLRPRLQRDCDYCQRLFQNTIFHWNTFHHISFLNLSPFRFSVLIFGYFIVIFELFFKMFLIQSHAACASDGLQVIVISLTFTVHGFIYGYTIIMPLYHEQKKKNVAGLLVTFYKIF